MATPMLAFDLVAREFGVDPTDPNQVDDFFLLRAPTLSAEEQMRIQEVLLACDGKPEADLARDFPNMWRTAAR